MNKLLELQLNVWKLTGTINRLQAVETRSTDEDTELTTATTEYAAVNAQLVAEGEREHTRLEAARLAHPTDPAERELRALCGRANVGEIMTAVMERRSVDGATLEAQQAYGLGPNQVPSKCSDSKSERLPRGRPAWRPRKRTCCRQFLRPGRGLFCLSTGRSYRWAMRCTPC